jgi:plasmid stability protein
MATLTIRNLDDTLKTRLRVVAAQHGHSMEEEVRQIIREALLPGEAAAPVHLADLAVSIFGPEHGVELALPARTEARPLPDFDA